MSDVQNCIGQSAKAASEVGIVFCHETGFGSAAASDRRRFQRRTRISKSHVRAR